MKLNISKNKDFLSGSHFIVKLREKFSIHLSRREKVLLSILGVAIFFVSYYYLILQPDLARINALQEQLVTLTNQKNQIESDISPSNVLHKDYKIMRARITSKVSRLFPSMKQEKIITTLNDMMKDSGLNGKSIAFTEPATEKVSSEEEKTSEQLDLLGDLRKQYNGELSTQQESAQVNTDNNQTGNNAPQVENQNIEISYEKMEASIRFEGTYSSLMKFIDEIEGYDKNIVIKNISAMNNQSSGLLNGTIVLVFNAVPRLFTEEDPFLEWDFEDTYGKTNPFDAYSSYVPAMTQNAELSNEDNGNAAAETTESTKTDFFMAARGITSDAPTVSLGKSDDLEGLTYVYADNPGVENVEFILSQEGSQYYYKYKTQYESYPKDYENEKMSFVPSGRNVTLRIESMWRGSKEDKSGINLSLVNKSDLQLNVEIENEDMQIPRIKIVNTFGNVRVKK